MSCSCSCQAKNDDTHKLMRTMLGMLKFQGKKDTAETKEQKSMALQIYESLTTKEQRHSFVHDFYDAEKGNKGKNLKVFVQMQRSITAESSTKIKTEEDFYSRPLCIHSFCLLASPELGEVRTSKIEHSNSEIQNSNDLKLELQIWNLQIRSSENNK